MNANTQDRRDIRAKRNTGALTRFFNVFSLKEKTGPVVNIAPDEAAEIMESIRDAKNEWINASMNFDYADNQDLIDYYTYRIKACEIRYDYYLKKAKEIGLKVDILEGSGNMTNH